ncbi:hypothetical protein DFH11DRAFT_1548681 [Phellopilus nigrolimitatus]|nr:hypothetical protein DFH11DRAFT_1548681 [Phellopilus nigrolimitatus]
MSERIQSVRPHKKIKKGSPSTSLRLAFISPSPTELAFEIAGCSPEYEDRPQVQSLCAQFTEVEQHACSLRSADALAPLLHAHVANPSYPTVTSSESPHFQREQIHALPLPHAIGAPSSGNTGKDWATYCNVRCGRHARETGAGAATGLRSCLTASTRRTSMRRGAGSARRTWRLTPTYDPHPVAWTAHAAPPPPLGGEPTHVSPIYPRDRETVSAGPISVSALPGTNGIKYASRFDVKYDSNAHAYSGSRRPSFAHMGYDDAGREHIRVDAWEPVRDAKEREYVSSRQRHHAPDVDYCTEAAHQCPNVSAVAQAHCPSRSRVNGAGVRGARRRSVSWSSAGSSWNIDEKLLETTRDREGGRRRDDNGLLCEPPTVHQFQTTILAPPITGVPPGKGSSQTSLTQSANDDARVNGLSPNGWGRVIEEEARRPQNTQSERICQQCGVFGYYKNGKCVEKWGPGPEGQYATDTITDAEPRPASHYREHKRDQERRAGSSPSYSGSPVSAYASAVASRRLHPLASAHLSQGQAYPSAATNMNASGLASQATLRLSPTPPYINSITSASSTQTVFPRATYLLDGDGDGDVSDDDEEEEEEEEEEKDARATWTSTWRSRVRDGGIGEYHTSRGCGRASQMDGLEDGSDRDADGDLPESWSGGGGDANVDGEEGQDGAEGSGESSGEGDADTGFEIMDTVDATMKVED